MNSNLYSLHKQYPQLLPFRIRLSDGRVRTDPSTFTDEEILDAGYVKAPAPPVLENKAKSLEWDGENWYLRDRTPDEIKQRWRRVRYKRIELMKEVDKLVDEYFENESNGTPQRVDIQDIDVYTQGLRDLTKQPCPFTLNWPELYDLEGSLILKR